MNSFSKVEESFLKISGIDKISTTTPYIIAPDLPKLSLMIALRFIEWVSENPNGVISLPADKHAPDYEIAHLYRILDLSDNNL